VTERPYRVVHLDEIEGHNGWLPVRRRLGIEAFGVNAWRPQADGTTVIGEHDEAASGHEELYLVLEGHHGVLVDLGDVICLDHGFWDLPGK
jgi:hypothetical protein